MRPAAHDASRLPTGLLIGDTWHSTSSAGTMQHVNPATGRVQAEFPVAGRSEVDESVRAGRTALTEFRKWSPLERRLLLQRIATKFREHAEEFSTIATLECGMIAPVADMMGESAAAWFDYYAGWTDKVVGSVIPGPSTSLNYTLSEPYGVVAVILTWNGPTGSIGMKVAAAFAAGCTVVLKPPELAPFGSNLFAQLCLEAGLPPGAINVVPGGADAGDALVRHPGIDKISFTGGPTTARRIQAACADSLTPLVLELGGKSANIVFADANLDDAARHAAQGITRLAGQVCHSPTRLLVEESAYDNVVSAVVRQLDDMRVGDPFDPESEMGPVINGQACERIMAVIDGAKREHQGALLAGGERIGGSLAEGFFIRPTAFGDVDPSASLAREEVFGPVLAITRFRSEEQAVEMANDSPYGLAAHLHTNDLSRAHRMAAALDVGNVAVNGGLANAGPTGPFGGVKDSGYGKEGGIEGIEEYLRVKNVNIKVSCDRP